MNDAPASGGPSRRRVVAGAAWAAPAVVIARPAPVSAASVACPAAVAIVTSGLSGNGVDLDLRHGKFRASATNTNPSNTSVVNLQLRVTDAGGAPLSGATVAVSSDERMDVEGNYLVGFSPPSVTGNITESTTKRTATEISDGSGLVQVKVSTATYQAADCPTVPAAGTWTAVVSRPGCANVTVTFSYRVYAPPGLC